MITNPEAIRYTNEIIRPLCEEIRALRAKIVSAKTAWDSGLGVHFDTVEQLDDGRDSEGVSRLTGTEITQAAGIFFAVSASVNDEIVSKPCVRPLAAN